MLVCGCYQLGMMHVLRSSRIYIYIYIYIASSATFNTIGNVQKINDNEHWHGGRPLLSLTHCFVPCNGWTSCAFSWPAPRCRGQCFSFRLPTCSSHLMCLFKSSSGEYAACTLVCELQSKQHNSAHSNATPRIFVKLKSPSSAATGQSRRRERRHEDEQN